MYDPAVARVYLVAAEVAAIASAVAAWNADVKSQMLSNALRICWALATTVAVFIPFTFFYVFTGTGPEAALMTFPLTLLAAPALFFLLLAKT